MHVCPGRGIEVPAPQGAGLQTASKSQKHRNDDTVPVSYNAAQNAGDLNVDAVGWNNANAQVSSLTDSSGNLYQLAVGPTVLAGSEPLTQAIYYAKNISAAAPGANTVFLTFNSAVASPDIRILEYRGIDPVNPLDAGAAATGNSAASSSGAATTTNPLICWWEPISSGLKRVGPAAVSLSAYSVAPTATSLKTAW